MFRRLFVVFTALCTTACSSVPAFVIAGSGPPEAPSGPKVAALFANLKCELYELANNDTFVITRYVDDTSLPTRPSHDKSRQFTLKNLFEEIEYVGEVKFSLDVTGTSTAAPSSDFINPVWSTSPLTLSVSGSIDSERERTIDLNSSVDFERLVPLQASRRGTDFAAHGPCGAGTELAGSLGLQEDLVDHFITSDMNDIAVWPKSPAGAGFKIPADESAYTIDQLHGEVDFTVTTGLKGGPNWMLSHFKGPGADTSLLDFSRKSKDSLVFTFIPVCIREKYTPIHHVGSRYEYSPEMIEGTPRWANYLPPCSSNRVNKLDGVAAAHSTNLDYIRGKAY